MGFSVKVELYSALLLESYKKTLTLWPKARSWSSKLIVTFFKNILDIIYLIGLSWGLNQVLFIQCWDIASVPVKEVFKASNSAHLHLNQHYQQHVTVDHTVLLETHFSFVLSDFSLLFPSYLLDRSFLVSFAGSSSSSSLLNEGIHQASLAVFTTRSSHLVS